MTAKMQRAQQLAFRQKAQRMDALRADYNSKKHPQKAKNVLRGLKLRRTGRVYEKQPHHSVAYHQRINSPGWLKLKAEIIAERGPYCEQCSRETRIDLHHKHYRNLGHEKPEDVRLLCRGCHEAEHRP